MNIDCSVNKLSAEWNLNDILVNNLIANEIIEFFPVQVAIIPLLLNFNSTPCVSKRDIAAASPTGSGKTLAYAIPIINVLMEQRKIRCPNSPHLLSALIILPSRELAVQVFNVFSKLIKGSDLIVFNINGQIDFSEEQQLLVGPFKKRKFDMDASMTFSNEYLYYNDTTDELNVNSNTDIIVCTPNRLLDHIHRTAGFSLKNLKFLILDEADRLLGNSYNFWVRSVIDSTRSNLYNSSKDVSYIDNNNISVQRLLFSATLTDNPRKLSVLGVRNPVIIKIGDMCLGVNDEKNSPDTSGCDDQTVSNNVNYNGSSNNDSSAFILPSTLSESIRICDTSEKPLELISVLMDELNYDHTHMQSNICMIFTSSVETTHRLATLLKLMNGQFETILPNKRIFGNGRVEEISRLKRANEREKTLIDASNSLVTVLVSTDNLARGIDLNNIKLVINYDPPKYPKTYVHRAGRTARANRSGHCLTILKKGQYGLFKKIRSAIGFNSSSQTSLPRHSISKETTDRVTPLYLTAITKLQTVLDSEI